MSDGHGVSYNSTILYILSFGTGCMVFANVFFLCPITVFPFPEIGADFSRIRKC